jgi:hypothetical protein
MALAPPVLPGSAPLARSARQKDLDGDAVALGHTPPRRGTFADGVDDADRLVARDEGEAGRQRARVLLVIGAAEPARLDAEEAVVGADVGEREVTRCQPARLLEDEGAGRGTRHHTIR